MLIQEIRISQTTTVKVCADKMAIICSLVGNGRSQNVIHTITPYGWEYCVQTDKIRILCYVHYTEVTKRKFWKNSQIQRRTSISLSEDKICVLTETKYTHLCGSVAK